MKKTLLLILCLACVLIGQTVVFAETDAATSDAAAALTAEQIMDKSIEASGGRTALEKIKSTHTKSAMELTGQAMKFDLEIFTKAPDKVLLIQEMPGLGQFMQGYDGKIGWSKDPFNGLREITGAELAMLKREAQSTSDIKWKELYKKAELVGTEKVNDSDAYKVQLTPEEGKPIIHYYDTKSFLLVRIDVTAESPQGNMTMESYPSDWKTVDGVKIPFMVTTKAPFGSMTMKITELKNNIEIDDSKFAKPADSKEPEKPSEPAAE